MILRHVGEVTLARRAVEDKIGEFMLAYILELSVVNLPRRNAILF